MCVCVCVCVCVCMCARVRVCVAHLDHCPRPVQSSQTTPSSSGFLGGAVYMFSFGLFFHNVTASNVNNTDKCGGNGMLKLV